MRVDKTIISELLPVIITGIITGIISFSLKRFLSHHHNEHILYMRFKLPLFHLTNELKGNIKGFKQDIIRFLTLLFLLIALLFLFFRIVRIIKWTGQLSMDLTDISCIHELTADSIAANLSGNNACDQSILIYLDNEVWLSSDSEISVRINKSDEWMKIDKVLIKPASNNSYISLINDSVQSSNKIQVNKILSEKNNKLYYSVKSNNRQVCHITSSNIICYLNFLIDNTIDHYSIRPTDCELIYYSNGVEVGTGSSVYLQLISQDDDSFSDILSAQSIIYLEQKNTTDSKSSVAVSIISDINLDQQSEETSISQIRVSNLKTLDMDCYGTIVWRYGTSVDEVLHGDRVSFTVDTSKNMHNLDSLRHDTDELQYSYPETVLNITQSGIKQVGKIDRTVNAYSLDSLDQFPNIGTYLINNWSGAIVITLILTIIGKIMDHRKKEGKE